MKSIQLLPLFLAAMALLSGCGTTIVSEAGAATAGMRPAPRTYGDGPARPSLPPGSAQHGGSGVIGRDSAALNRMFGAARLDRHDGPAHVMQYAGSQCVLDAYLYAPRAGAEPVVTHIDTRSIDGANMDRDACIATLQRR
ncbi:MAG: hypothetical protein ABL909_09975 [Sphingopyxis sp.]